MKKIKSMVLQRLDLCGVGVSLLCGLHCLIIPMLTMLMPIFSISFFFHHDFHLYLTGLSFLLLLASLSPSYFSIHNNLLPIVIGLIGFGLLTMSIYMYEEMYEILCSAAGGSAVAFAHVKNRMLIVAQRPKKSKYASSIITA